MVNSANGSCIEGDAHLYKICILPVWMSLRLLVGFTNAPSVSASRDSMSVRVCVCAHLCVQGYI